ncbi:MAG: Iron-sulfur cluster assembly protein SufD [uncultured Sulfurovum sp.]|uniref:Iron-sulfur cluster assembly protein SufD n=1 Tax=uncultured Sulfurovum sp. TaxID=269237 RepID=A0A6S6U5Y6_9BACT|nr:MAG: Iron-sulfur cluster assembly protein SufD [uncultured Sulfurovum sp.]
MNLTTLKNQNLQEVNSLLEVKGRDILTERFVSLGLPSKKSEEYRYFDVEKLLEVDYKTLNYVPKTLKVSDKIEIVDGVVVAGPQSMRIYNEPCGQIDMDHYDPLYYLGHLLSPHAIKIELDGDVEVEIEHKYTQSDALINYRIVLYNQVNRHATVYESFVSEDIENSLVLYGYDMHIARDSSLRVVKLQTMQDSGYAMVASHKLNVDKNAHAVYKSFDLGGDNALQLIKVDLEERAEVDAGHLLYLNSKAKRGTVTQIVHRGAHSRSQQEAKNILDGDARGIFDALIRVEETGKFTKAHQNSKAILLHDKAYMAAKPQLEIYIDELEASHGATTGQLSEKQLFYLQSRGITRVEARKMLVIAFANTLIETVKDSRHQERIKNAFEEVFYATNEG